MNFRKNNKKAFNPLPHFQKIMLQFFPCTLFILCLTWSDAIHSLFSLANAVWISKAGTPLRGHEFKYGQPEGFGGFQEVLAHFLQLSPQTRAEDHWATQYIQVSLASWPCINRLQIAFTKQTKSHPTIDKIQRSPTLHNLDQFWQDLWRSFDKRESQEKILSLRLLYQAIWTFSKKKNQFLDFRLWEIWISNCPR